MTVTPEVTITQIISQDDDNIGLRNRDLRGAGRRQGNAYEWKKVQHDSHSPD
jgi:hypothetical protein